MGIQKNTDTLCFTITEILIPGSYPRCSDLTGQEWSQDIKIFKSFVGDSNIQLSFGTTSLTLCEALPREVPGK